MAGADYWYCPICNQKALYDDSDQDGADIEVVHQQCLERDRTAREQALREKIATEIEAARPLGGAYFRHTILTDAARIARGGQP
jgi:hypothetical protein